MAEIITNLHPDGDENTNLYPNIKKDNIPNKAISTDKLDDNVLSLIGSLKPSGTDTSANILAYTSNKGIYVATDNGHWYYWNGTTYADGGVYQTAVNYDELEDNIENLKTSFFKLDKGTSVTGYIDNNGNIVDLSNWRTTDFIECNTKYLTIKGELRGFSSSGYRYICCYNSNKQMIGFLLDTGVQTTYTFNDYTNIKLIPNTSYIRVCNGKSYYNNFDLFINPKNELIVYNKIYKNLVNIPVNPNDYVVGYIESNGKLNPLSGFKTSDFIEVTSNKLLIQSNLRGIINRNYINFFDENKGFLSGISTGVYSDLTEITLPDNTRYVRFSGNDFFNNGVEIYNTYDERYKLKQVEEPTEIKSVMDDNFYGFRKFGVIGDSLSVGHMYNEYTEKPVGENLQYSWPYFMARKCGSQAICFGFSGATTKTFWDNNRQLLTKEGNKCQCYILCLGVNDRDTIGSLSDIDWSDYNKNQDTYYGRYARIIQYLKEINPLAPVFCFNMPNPYGSIYPNINTAIRDIVSNTPLDGVYLVDLTQYNVEFNEVNTTEFFDYHYTPMGYNAIAKINQKALSKVMLDNSDKFRSIAFIPID